MMTAGSAIPETASHMPSAGVVIPTYNRWPLVCRAIDSVLSQTYPRVVCIVVDDHSTDQTAQQISERYGERVQLIVQPENREKSAARNAGIRAADTEYICMLDSDDELTPWSVADRMHLFARDPGFHGVAYGPSYRGEGPVPRNIPAAECPQGDVLAQYIDAPFLDNNGFLLPRDAMLECGMYRDDLTNREDMELLIRLAARLEFRCCGSYIAQVHATAVSARSNYQKYLEQGQKAIEYLQSDPVIAKRLGKRLEKLQFGERLELARAMYKSRRYSEFRAAVRELAADFPVQTLRQGRLWRRWVCSLLSTRRSGGET